jgi:hypothetical protein
METATMISQTIPADDVCDFRSDSSMPPFASTDTDSSPSQPAREVDENLMETATMISQTIPSDDVCDFGSDFSASRHFLIDTDEAKRESV